MNGIGKIGRMVAAAEAKQIGKIDAKTGVGEDRREVMPVFRARTEAVDEHNDRSIGRSFDEIVDAMAGDLEVTAVDAGKIFLEIGGSVEEAEGTQIKACGRSKNQCKHDPEGPSQKFHCVIDFPFGAIVHAANLFRARAR